MQEKIVKIIKKILGWPLSLIALFFLIKIIAPKTLLVLPHFKQINLLGLFFGIVSLVIYFFLRGFIWQNILKLKGYFVPLKDAIFLWEYSELKRYVPGGIWSFLGRAITFSNKGITKKEIVHSLIIEAQFIVLSSSFLSIFSLFLFKDLSLSLIYKEIVVAFILLILVVFVFHNIFFKFTNKSFLKYILPNFTPRQSFFMLCTSIIAFSFFGLGTYLVSSSLFYLDLKYVVGFIGFFAFSLLAGYLSLITPMGLGVREGVMTIGLSKIIPLEFAGLLSIFSRLMFILSEIIFILFAFIWMYSRNKLLLKIEKIIRSNKQEFVLAFFICVYIIYFIVASFLRYDNFYTGRFDLGNMDQTVWNTVSGRVFETSADDGSVISRLSAHADFMLILLSPFYLLWPHPKTLLLVQAVVLSIGAIFVFLIGKSVLRNKNLALMFGLLYLMNPMLQFANLYDFHAVTLATTLLLASFYFLIKQKYFLLTAFLILSGITKEQVWVITSLFGFPLLLQKAIKIKLFGAGIIFFSLFIFGYLIWYAIPQSLGSEHFALAYYQDFGNSPTQVVSSVLFSPQKLLSTIFEDSRLSYLKQIFIPLGFISLLSPFLLIFSVPDLLINLLSNNSHLHEIYYQYTSTITPFIFISGIFGVKQFIKWFPQIPKIYITFYLLIFTFLSAYFFGPLPGSKNPNLDMFTKPQSNKEAIENFLLTIPKHYTVAATNNLGSHLSQREIIYTIPVGLDKADIVMFLGGEGKMVDDMKHDKNYAEILRIENFVVFKKRGNLL